MVSRRDIFIANLLFRPLCPYGDPADGGTVAHFPNEPIGGARNADLTPLDSAGPKMA
jgi:hypothetical protein